MDEAGRVQDFITERKLRFSDGTPRRERFRVYAAGGRTSFSNRLSSAVWGWWWTREWTGDGGMIVLRGATSQWNRARCGSAPIDPASAPPAQSFGIESR